MKETKTLISKLSLGRVKKMGGGEKTLAILTIFVLFGLTFSSCRACDCDKDKSKAKIPNDITSALADPISKPAIPKPPDNATQTSDDPNIAEPKPAPNLDITEQALDPLIQKQKEKELEEAVKKKAEDADREKEAVRKARKEGDNMTKMAASVRAWDAANDAVTLTKNAKSNGINVSNVAKGYVAQAWAYAADASFYGAADALATANSVVWWAEAEDQERAKQAMGSIDICVHHVNVMFRKTYGGTPTEEENEAFGKDVDWCWTLNIAEEKTEDENEENARIFGKDWDWKIVKDSVDAAVALANEAIAKLKNKNNI
jgi:hypothetical protein